MLTTVFHAIGSIADWFKMVIDSFSSLKDSFLEMVGMVPAALPDFPPILVGLVVAGVVTIVAITIFKYFKDVI